MGAKMVVSAGCRRQENSVYLKLKNSYYPVHAFNVPNVTVYHIITLVSAYDDAY